MRSRITVRQTVQPAPHLDPVGSPDAPPSTTLSPGLASLVDAAQWPGKVRTPAAGG